MAFKKIIRSSFMQKNFSIFYKNSLNLFMGKLISNLITFAFFPLLTRLYSQEEIGINSTLLSISSFLTVFFSLQFNQSILVQKKKKDYDEITNIILLISILFLLFFLFIFFVFDNKLIKIFNLEITPIHLLLVPLLSFNISLYNTFRNWLIKEKSFGLISKNLVLKNIFNNLSLTLLGFSPFGYFGLFISKFIAELIGTFSLFLNYRLFNTNNLNLKNINTVFKKNIKYPTVTLPHSIFTSLSSELPFIIITSFFSPIITGIYFLSLKVTSIPFQMISSSIGNIFFEEFINHPNKFFVFKKRIKELFLFHMIFLLIISIIYYYFIDLFFGYEFGVIGGFTTYFAILFCSKSLSSIFGNPVLLYLKKNELNFSFEIYNFITMLISIFIGIYFKSIFTFISLNILTNTIIIIIKLKLCYDFLKDLERKKI